MQTDAKSGAGEGLGVVGHFLPDMPSVNRERNPPLAAGEPSPPGVSCSGAGPGSSESPVAGAGACATSPREASASGSPSSSRSPAPSWERIGAEGTSPVVGSSSFSRAGAFCSRRDRLPVSSEFSISGPRAGCSETFLSIYENK